MHCEVSELGGLWGLEDQGPAVLPADFPRNPDGVQVPDTPDNLYDLNALNDAPQYFKLMGRPRQQFENDKTLKVGVLEVLAKWHLWGMIFLPKRCQDHGGRPTRTQIINGLFKLFYWMRPDCRPQTWAELFDINRDGGPRLLNWDLIPTPPPISRYYPVQLSYSTLAQKCKGSFSRPSDAPQEIADCHFMQLLLSISVPSPQGPVGNHRDPPSETETFSGTIDRSNSPIKMTDVIRSHDGSCLRCSQHCISNLNLQPATLGKESHIYRVDFKMNSIRVAIERSLINITYADLERHPQAPVKEPIATRTANTSDDLSHIQIGAHTTISEVRLNVLTHQFDPSGFAFPYRGRGPVWADGSCAIDVSVVLGMLSDAGCTVVDRENDADKAFGEIERAFIQVTNMNWDAFNDEVSIQLRHSFYKLLCDNCPSIEINEPIPIWTVWAESTRSFKQFTFGYIEAPIEQCVHCGNTIKDVKRGTGHTIIPPWKANDEKGVTVPELVERCWNSEPKHIICEGCGSHTGPTVIRAVEKLPLRLVVSTSAGFLVLNHTQDLVFNYIDTEGFTRTATYRWLGGAYYRNNHTRVYWTDAERGGFDTGYIRKYDSMDAAGTIIGGLPPYAQDERIHPDWTEKGIPIIIYERVMNPSTDVLHAAQQSVSDMMNMVSEGKYVLNEHYPWLPTPPVPRRPEPRILPDYGDRFVESSTSSGNLIYQTSDHAANGRPGVELTGDSKYAVARWIAEKIIDIDGLSSDSAGNMSMKRRASQLGLLEDPPFEQAKKCSKIFTSLLDDPSSLRDCPEVWEGSVPPTSGGMMRFPKLSVPLSSKRDRSKGSSLWEYFQTAKEISGSKNPSKSGAAGVVNWVSMNQAICNTRRPPYCVYPIPVALIKKAMKERASELQEEQQELYGRRKRAQMEGTKDEGTSPIRKRRIRA